MFEKRKVRAHRNIALIKYWGKKDEDLKIPFQSSLSFTVDKLYTETEVVFSNNLLEDKIIINDKEDEKVNFRVKKHLDYIRNKFNVSKYAYVNSKNYVPIAAGLASSASAFAALTYAAIKELGPNPEITRFKGLGEISPDEFVHFIGKDIRLDKVSMRKEDLLKELLEFYMGKNTMERQNFIIDNLVVLDVEV